MTTSSVKLFEKNVAEFFGAPYAVAVDCCTHGVELCLRYVKAESVISPHRTYPSIPFLAEKLSISLVWKDEAWQDYYEVGYGSQCGTPIYDAAVLWKRDAYLPNSLMCLSFQFQKHLSLGRGGMILTDNEDTAQHLRRMVHDGREPSIPWREQNISHKGYHYYMTPETATLGLQKLPEAIAKEPRRWVLEDWPDLTKMEIFK
jgi:dTDP-4-amino-4,6-dideoxygalactose transaminase